MNVKLMALNLVAPLLRRIVLDMISTNMIVGIRENILDLFRGLAQKTGTEFDDYLVEEYIAKALEPENFDEYGSKLLDWSKAFVLHTKTDFDDTWVLPIIIRFEEVLALPE